MRLYADRVPTFTVVPTDAPDSSKVVFLDEIYFVCHVRKTFFNLFDFASRVENILFHGCHSDLKPVLGPWPAQVFGL